MIHAFDTKVCAPVREHLGRPVRLPSVGTWSLEHERGTPVLRLELSAAELGHNLQTDRAAAPFFLMCFAYWYGRVQDIEPRLRVDIGGSVPTRTGPLRHYRRAWIALEAMEEALGERLAISGAPAERWPPCTVLNAPRVARATTAANTTGAEHQVEVLLTRDAHLADEFSTRFAPITGFRRQLPLGLFDGEVSGKRHWTPGGGAQADLWSTSPDGSVFHLFELKVRGNAKVGVLPELLAYLWILHRVRVGWPDGRAVIGGGPGAEAARGASRIAGWIVAPHLHPLLLGDGRSPLEWVADGLSGRIELGVAPFDDGGEKTAFNTWRSDAAWPSTGR